MFFSSLDFHLFGLSEDDLKGDERHNKMHTCFCRWFVGLKKILFHISLSLNSIYSL